MVVEQPPLHLSSLVSLGFKLPFDAQIPHLDRVSDQSLLDLHVEWAVSSETG